MSVIGQKFATIEAKIILAQIFRNYEIESKFKMEENVPILDLVFNSENGIVIRIKKRTPRAWLCCGIRLIFYFVRINQLFHNKLFYFNLHFDLFLSDECQDYLIRARLESGVKQITELSFYFFLIWKYCTQERRLPMKFAIFYPYDICL